MIGKEVTVLPEKIHKGMLQGKTDTFKTMQIGGEGVSDNLIGSFVRARVTDADTWGMSGVLAV